MFTYINRQIVFTYINTTYTNKVINRHSEPADKCPSFQTYQVMLVESGHKVFLEVTN